MTLRQETENDVDEVGALVKVAFATAEHSDGTEHTLIEALRHSAAFVPQLSLVAKAEGRIVGHILFTEGQVGGRTVLALAPLAVHPDAQRQGVGTALVREGHRIAAALGYGHSVVLGSERYYPRIGYIPAERLGIRAPFAVPPENFMAMRLREDAAPVQGVMTYAPEFRL